MHRGEDHAKTEAETGVIQLQAKECQQLLETKREAGTDSSEAPEETSPADTLIAGFWPPEP